MQRIEGDHGIGRAQDLPAGRLLQDDVEDMEREALVVLLEHRAPDFDIDPGAHLLLETDGDPVGQEGEVHRPAREDKEQAGDTECNHEEQRHAGDGNASQPRVALRSLERSKRKIPLPRFESGRGIDPTVGPRFRHCLCMQTASCRIATQTISAIAT